PFSGSPPRVPPKQSEPRSSGRSPPASGPISSSCARILSRTSGGRPTSGGWCKGGDCTTRRASGRRPSRRPRAREAAASVPERHVRGAAGGDLVPVLLLLVPEGGHRVGRGGSPRREVSRRESEHRQQEGGADECRRILGPQPEQLAG